MLSRFYLPVAAAVQAFQIHAREIGVFLVQIVPLADSARLAREFLANELFAGISHLFFGFARDVNFMFYRFGGLGFDLDLGLSLGFDLGIGFDLSLSISLSISLSLGYIVRIVRGHDYNVPVLVPSQLLHQFFLKMDKTKKFMLYLHAYDSNAGHCLSRVFFLIIHVIVIVHCKCFRTLD